MTNKKINNIIKFAAATIFAVLLAACTEPAVMYRDAGPVCAKPEWYTGNCYCPNDVDTRGNRCGGRSATSRPGGAGK